MENWLTLAQKIRRDLHDAAFELDHVASLLDSVGMTPPARKLDAATRTIDEAAERLEKVIGLVLNENLAAAQASSSLLLKAIFSGAFQTSGEVEVRVPERDGNDDGGLVGD